jgi:hypothetical protein
VDADAKFRAGSALVGVPLRADSARSLMSPRVASEASSMPKLKLK